MASGGPRGRMDDAVVGPPDHRVALALREIPAVKYLGLHRNVGEQPIKLGLDHSIALAAPLLHHLAIDHGDPASVVIVGPRLNDGLLGRFRCGRADRVTALATDAS